VVDDRAGPFLNEARVSLGVNGVVTRWCGCDFDVCDAQERGEGSVVGLSVTVDSVDSEAVGVVDFLGDAEDGFCHVFC